MLTAHEPSSTLPLDEKGRLKSLFPGLGCQCEIDIGSAYEKDTKLVNRLETFVNHGGVHPPIMSRNRSRYRLISRWNRLVLDRARGNQTGWTLCLRQRSGTVVLANYLSSRACVRDAVPAETIKLGSGCETLPTADR